MKKRYRLKDVAALTGYSISTVSRVLNEHPDVSDTVRTVIRSAIKELNFEPDSGARSLRSGVTRAIGFLVRDILTPTFAEYVMGIQQTLHIHGYTLILRCSL